MMNVTIGDWVICKAGNHRGQYTSGKPYKVTKIVRVSDRNIQILHSLDDRGKDNGLSEVGFSRILFPDEARLAELLFA